MLKYEQYTETAGTLISIINSQSFRLLISKNRIRGERRRDAFMLFKINYYIWTARKHIAYLYLSWLKMSDDVLFISRARDRTCSYRFPNIELYIIIFMIFFYAFTCVVFNIYYADVDAIMLITIHLACFKNRDLCKNNITIYCEHIVK